MTADRHAGHDPAARRAADAGRKAPGQHRTCLDARARHYRSVGAVAYRAAKQLQAMRQAGAAQPKPGKGKAGRLARLRALIAQRKPPASGHPP